MLAALGGAAVRLVLRAADRRLSRDADAGVRPDRLVDRFQWYDVTGGDNGILGVWPSAWASSAGVLLSHAGRVAGGGILACGSSSSRRSAWACAPVAIPAARGGDRHRRARHQRLAFVIAGGFAGVAGALYAFFKGSVFPDVLAIPLSVDALVMVLLGGVQTLTGPVVGAAVYKTLQVSWSAWTDYWRLIIGVVIIALVVAFPRASSATRWNALAPLPSRPAKEAHDPC